MSGSLDKPFRISKLLVWEAYERVRANKGAAGVDRRSLADFESDLRNNLYKIWNRMSSGTYFPPAVMAVEIPKSGGGGTRVLGVPTVADRVAQTVAAMTLEARTESIFHSDSYGYRPRRSALDAVARCRQRCWKKYWVIDLDVAKFFDSVPWDLMVKAVAANITTDQEWVLLYVKRFVNMNVEVGLWLAWAPRCCARPSWWRTRGSGSDGSTTMDEMEEFLDLRSRLVGGGFKPPTGALAEDRGLERCGKRRDVIASGVGREDERWVERPSVVRSVENILGGIKTGVYRLSRDKSGSYPLTAQAVSGVQAA